MIPNKKIEEMTELELLQKIAISNGYIRKSNAVIKGIMIFFLILFFIGCILSFFAWVSILSRFPVR